MVTTDKKGTRGSTGTKTGTGHVEHETTVETESGGTTGGVKQKKAVQIYLTTPLVYEFRTKRKRNRRKKKYSRDLKTLQRTEDGLTLAGRRFGDAIESGFRTYRRKRNKSARRRKDGAIRDILPNSANGISRFINVGSDIPYDVARRVNSKRFGKQLRDAVQLFTRPFFR